MNFSTIDTSAPSAKDRERLVIDIYNRFLVSLSVTDLRKDISIGNSPRLSDYIVERCRYARKMAVLLMADTHQKFLNYVILKMRLAPEFSRITHGLAIHYVFAYYDKMIQYKMEDINDLGSPAAIYMICFRLAVTQLEDYTLLLRRSYNLARIGSYSSDIVLGVKNFDHFKKLEWQVIYSLNFGVLPLCHDVLHLANHYDPERIKPKIMRATPLSPLLSTPKPAAFVPRVVSRRSLWHPTSSSNVGGITITTFTKSYE